MIHAALGAAVLMAVQPQAGLPAHPIEVEGVSRYDPDHLLAFAIEHVREAGQPVTDVHLVEAVEIIYREDGYFLAEAVIFERGDDWVLHVNEGHVEAVRVLGLDEEAGEAIARRFDPIVGQRAPLFDDFQRRFLLADDLAGIDLEANFRRDGQEGSILELHGRGDDGYALLSLDTVNIEDGTALRLVGDVVAHSVLGTGDKLRAALVGSVEFDDGSGLAGFAAYRTPVGSSGLYFEARGGSAFAERDVDELVIDSTLEGLQVAAGLGYPVVRTATGFAFLLAEAEYRQADSRAGDSDFESESRALRFYAVGGDTTESGLHVEGELGLSVGVAERSATALPIVEAEEEFAHLNAVLGMALPLGEATRLQAEAAGQLALTDLPELENFYVGHQPSLRGYHLGEGRGDSAIVGSLSLDQLLVRKEEAQLAGFLFVEGAWLDQRARGVESGSDVSLLSTGAGLRGDLDSGWQLEGWVAVPLEDGPATEAGEVAAYVRISKVIAL